MKIEDLEDIPKEMLLEAAHACRFYATNGSYARCGKAGRKIIAELKRQETKVIDMAVFMNAGIDCEFSDDGKSWVAAPLEAITISNYYVPVTRNGERLKYLYCRPRMNYWFTYRNLNQPWIKVLIYTLIRAGFTLDIAEDDSIIYEFKIIGLKDGYILPGAQFE